MAGSLIRIVGGLAPGATSTIRTFSRFGNRRAVPMSMQVVDAGITAGTASYRSGPWIQLATAKWHRPDMICMSQMRPQSILTSHDAMRGFEILGKAKAMSFHVVGMGALHAATRR